MRSRWAVSSLFSFGSPASSEGDARRSAARRGGASGASVGATAVRPVATLALVGAAAAAIFACDAGGAAGDGAATVSGSVAGIPIADPSALGAVAIDPPGAARASRVRVSIRASGPRACGAANPPGAGLDLEIALFGAAPSVPAGAYAIEASDARAVTATFRETDAACAPLAVARASGGTITLREVTAGHLRGAFALTFPRGDALEGTFDAPACPPLAAADAGGPTCVW